MGSLPARNKGPLDINHGVVYAVDAAATGSLPAWQSDKPETIYELEPAATSSLPTRNKTPRTI